MGLRGGALKRGAGIGRGGEGGIAESSKEMCLSGGRGRGGAVSLKGEVSVLPTLPFTGEDGRLASSQRGHRRFPERGGQDLPSEGGGERFCRLSYDRGG